MGHGWTRIIQI